jgi:hypothetical protein
MISLMMAKHRLKNLEITLKTFDRKYNNIIIIGISMQY